ncbi:MAG: AEC family transporter [Gammaproteobacteria bacterium]
MLAEFRVVFDIVLPILVLGLAGYAGARAGYLSPALANGLSAYVFDIAMPVVLLRTFANMDMPADPPWALLASFYLPGYAVFLGTMLVARRWHPADRAGRVLTAYGCCAGNAVLIGLPLISRAAGDAGLVPYFILMTIHTLAYLTPGTILIELSRNRSGSPRALPREVLRAVGTNPIIVATVVGLAMNALSLRLPAALDDAAQYLSESVTPCALIALGAALSRYHLRGGGWQTAYVATVKLFALPALVALLALYVFELDRTWAMVAVLLSAQPSAIMFQVLAERYQAAQAAAASAVLITTVASIVWMPVLLFLFHR